MDLSKRLANLDRLTRKNKSPSDQMNSGQTGLADSHEPVPEKCLTDLGLAPAGPGNWPAWVRNITKDLSVTMGGIPSLDGFFTRAHEANPEPGTILFMDTETTGLAGGTGTIAFLVGVGWISEEKFVSRQYFLPDFAHETHMLEELHQLAKGFEVVMTFNGASFDLPLLRTRALMNRLPDPCGELVSWDLLVPGRRLWGRHFSDCRQQTLEKGLLDLERGPDDIDGALIPQAWFDFIRDRDGEMMSRVLHHNHMDLLGMVGLLSRVLDMARLLRDNQTWSDHWLQAWALGRVAEKARLRQEASTWMLKAIHCQSIELEQGFRQAAFVKDSIRLLKREKAWLPVENVISKALLNGLDEPWLHREAAILFEHRLRKPGRALAHAKLCGESSRVQRLEKKIATIEGNHD